MIGENQNACRDAQEWIDSARTDGRPVLAFCFYHQSRIPDESFRAVYHAIADCFSLLSITDGQTFSMPGPVFVVPKEAIRLLRHVNLFVCLDSCQVPFPDESFVVAFPHSYLGYDYPMALLTFKYNLRFFDAYCTTTPQTLKDAELLRTAHTFRLNPKGILRKRKKFFFAATGCPRMAAIRQYLKDHPCEQNSLLYAPTDYPWRNEREIRSHMVSRYGTELVGGLLESFPEYNIVFRPCSTTWNHPYTLDLIRKHTGHPRFKVSLETDHAPEFARTARLLTDYSNIGEIFALTTLRPEIRMELETPCGQRGIIGTGITVNPGDDVIAAVRRNLAPPDAVWSSYISRCFKGYTFNPETTLRRIRAVLLDFASDRANSGTVDIPRDNSLPPWDPLDYCRNILFQKLTDTETADSFFKDFPEDPVALTMALTAQQLQEPDYTIEEPLLNALNRHLNAGLEPHSRYVHFTHDMGLALLHRGYTQAMHDGKKEYAELLRIFITTF